MCPRTVLHVTHTKLDYRNQIIFALVLVLAVTMVHVREKSSDQNTRELEAAELKQPGVMAQFGTTRFPPPQSVIGLLLSSDEKYFVTVSNMISVWDAELGLVQLQAAYC